LSTIDRKSLALLYVRYRTLAAMLSLGRDSADQGWN